MSSGRRLRHRPSTIALALGRAQIVWALTKVPVVLTCLVFHEVSATSGRQQATEMGVRILYSQTETPPTTARCGVEGVQATYCAEGCIVAR